MTKKNCTRKTEGANKIQKVGVLTPRPRGVGGHDEEEFYAKHRRRKRNSETLVRQGWGSWEGEATTKKCTRSAEGANVTKSASEDGQGEAMTELHAKHQGRSRKVHVLNMGGKMQGAC